MRDLPIYLAVIVVYFLACVLFFPAHEPAAEPAPEPQPSLPAPIADFDTVKIDDHEAYFAWTDADGQRWTSRMSREEWNQAVKNFVGGEE